MDRNYVKNLLEELLNIYSPTGDTENAICFMEKKFKELNIPCRRTNKNALIATIEGEEKEAITFSGHVDTLGLMVKEIKANGRLAFSLVGGFSPTSVETENVFIKTYNGKLIPGTALYNEASVHVYDTTTTGQRSIKNMEIRIDEDVKKAVLDGVKYLESQGAIVEEVSLPNTDYAISTYYIIASAEASSNLSRFDGIRYGYRSPNATNLEEIYKKTRGEGFGAEVKRRIMLGTYVLSSGYYDAYYKKAQQVRTLIKEDFDRVFKEYDVIIGPTAPTVAFNIGEEIGDPVTMYANDILTIPVNMAGLPGLSIPCGFKGKRPIGMQLIAKPFAESTLYDVAYNFEQHYNLHDKKIEL